MRTMLISLALIAALAQIVIGSLEPTPFNVNECGPKTTSKYRCFALEKCTDDKKKSEPVNKNEVIEIKANDSIIDGCPGIIRYHQYAENNIYVIIEAFEPLDKIKSITFRIDEIGTKPKTEFNCAADTDKKEIKGFAIKHEEMKKDISSNITVEKLVCAFEHKKPGDGKIFDSTNRDRVFMIINEVLSKPTMERVTAELQCDPALFTFEHDAAKTKRFAKVIHDRHRPLEYSCKDNYTMEYRKSGEYEPVTGEITCTAHGSFFINGNDTVQDTAINIRCAVETKYFCDYEPKWAEETTTKKRGERKAPKYPVNATELKCPNDHPYLEVGEKQIFDPKFECLSFGGEPVWTIEQDRFTKHGPEIHCTNQRKCKLRISESAIHKGYIGNDLLPMCYPQGAMHIGDSEANKKKIDKMQCDPESGNYNYTLESGGGGFIDANTKFLCTYPVITNEAANRKNDQTIWQGTAIAGGVCGGIALILLIACFVFVCIRVRRNKRKAAVEAKQDFYKYCADDKETKEIEQKRAEGKVSWRSERDEACVWNALAMSMQYMSLAFFPNENGLGEMSSEDHRELSNAEEIAKKIGMSTICQTKYPKEKLTEYGSNTARQRQKHKILEDRIEARQKKLSKESLKKEEAPKKN